MHPTQAPAPEASTRLPLARRPGAVRRRGRDLRLGRAAWHVALVVLGLTAATREVLLLKNTFVGVPPAGADSAPPWHQAERIRQDLTVYEPYPGYGPHVMAWQLPGGEPFPATASPHLPLPASIIALLPRTTLPEFQRILGALLLVATVLFAVVLSKLSTGGISVPAVAGWFGAIHLVPYAYFAVRTGNIDPVLWLLFAVAVCSRRWSGAVLAAMVLIKPFALWPLLYVLIRYREARRSALMGGLAAATVCVAAFGPADLVQAAVDWLRTVPSAMGQGTFSPHNVSVSFAVLRGAHALGWWEYTAGPMVELWPRLWLTTAQVAGPVAAIYLTRRMDPRMGLSLVMLASLLLSPLCWGFYLAVGLVPVALLVRRVADATPSQAPRPMPEPAGAGG